MDYGDIIGSSFKVAWRNKSLWIFGLFASGFSGMNTGWQGEDELFGDGVTMENFFSENLWVAPAVVGIILLIAIATLLLKSISIPALIDGTNRLTRGGVYRFGVSLQTGVSYMWRQLGLLILHALVYLGFFGIMIALGVVLAITLGWIAALGLIVAIPLTMAVVFGVWTTFQLAYRAVVVRDAAMSDALSEGWALLKANFGHCVVIFVIYVALALGIGILVAIIFAILALPLVAVGLLSEIDTWLLILIGVPLMWIIMLPIGGFLGATYENILTIFYFRLYEAPAQPASPGPAAGPTSG